MESEGIGYGIAYFIDSDSASGINCEEIRRKPESHHSNADVENAAVPSIKQEELHSLCTELADYEEAQCVPNGAKSIECFICGQQFRKIYKLRLHMKMHACVEDYTDSSLEESSIYNTLNPFSRNIETRIIRDFLVCEINAKRYSQFYAILSEADVELHISDSETESESEAGARSDSQFIPRNIYKCDLCKIDFDRRYKALFHQRTSHSRSSLLIQCDYCGRRYIGAELLIHHLKTQCESDEKPISCVERFKKYFIHVNLEEFESLAQTRKELRVQRLATAQKTYNCHVCSKIFTRSEHLRCHKAVHLPEESKYECPVCFRRFNRKDNMRSHIKVHMQEAECDSSSNQLILCQYCGNCFTSKSNYVVHIRRHTGDKPFKCNVCGKGFAKSTDLSSHKITHSGEKKFKCNICRRLFARRVVLSKHMRTHAGPFQCNICTHSFLRPNELATHLRSHVSGGQGYNKCPPTANAVTSNSTSSTFEQPPFLMKSPQADEITIDSMDQDKKSHTTARPQDAAAGLHSTPGLGSTGPVPDAFVNCVVNPSA